MRFPSLCFKNPLPLITCCCNKCCEYKIIFVISTFVIAFTCCIYKENGRKYLQRHSLCFSGARFHFALSTTFLPIQLIYCSFNQFIAYWIILLPIQTIYCQLNYFITLSTTSRLWYYLCFDRRYKVGKFDDSMCEWQTI